MINDLLKQNPKYTIQKAISYYISEGLIQELSNLKKLPDDKCAEMCGAIGIKTTDNDIYYNNFNIMFDNSETHDEFKHYLKADSCVFRLEISEMNVNLWAYALSENHLLNNMLGN